MSTNKRNKTFGYLSLGAGILLLIGMVSSLADGASYALSTLIIIVPLIAIGINILRK